MDAFAPYDRIPTAPLRQDLPRLIETAVRTRIPAYARQPGRRAPEIAEMHAACGRLTMVDRASLYRYAVISILAALATIVLKGGAYVITGVGGSPSGSVLVISRRPSSR